MYLQFFTLSRDECLVSQDENRVSRDATLVSRDENCVSQEGGNLLLSGTVIYKVLDIFISAIQVSFIHKTFNTSLALPHSVLVPPWHEAFCGCTRYQHLANTCTMKLKHQLLLCFIFSCMWGYSGLKVKMLDLTSVIKCTLLIQVMHHEISWQI